MISKSDHSKSAFLAAAGVAAVLFTFIYLYSPLEADDYWFLEGTQGMRHGWEMFLTACETMKERWFTETGRLGNLINPIFLALLPKCVFDIISGLMFFVMVVFACRLASARLGSLSSYLLLAGLVFCFPWYDYMFCITFGINYVWGISLALMASYYLLKSTERGWKTALVCVLCFCAGWFHEGFGAPLSCGAVGVAAIRFSRHNLDRGFLYKLISLCAGTLMICVSPVFWNRAETQISNIVKFPVKELVMQVGPSVMIFVVFLLALAAVVIFAGSRNRLRSADAGYERTVFFTVFMIAAMAITLKYYNGPRTGAAVITFGMTGTLWLLKECGFRPLNASFGSVVKALFAAAVFINLGYAVYAQRLIKDEYNKIVSLFTASPDGTIYFDISFPEADLSMYKTTVRQFHERIPKSQIAHYLNPDKKLVILPSALKAMTVDELRPATRDGFYTYNGYIMCEPPAAPEEFQITVITNEGTKARTRYRLDPFRIAGGKELVFIMPHIQTLAPELKISDVVYGE